MPPDARAPVILSLETNVTTLGPGDTLIITALVTDPDGIDDVIGGTVRDPVSGGTYGALQSQAQEGSYSISLSFAAIHTVRPIETPPGGAQRTFEARFADVAGNFSTDEVTVTLACDNAAQALCDGSCTSLQGDELNCGMCGKACGGSALNGECLAGLCYDSHTVNDPMACSAACQALGKTCVVRPDQGGAEGAIAGIGNYRRGADCCCSLYLRTCSEVPPEESVLTNCGSDLTLHEYQTCYCRSP
jgi:hypothetical protein